MQGTYNERIERAAREDLSGPTRLHRGEYGTAVDSADEEAQIDWDKRS